MGIALLAEAGLSFLGVGIQPPRSSWGGMLSKASTYVYQQPFLVLPPGLAISAVVLTLNMLGDGIRDQLGAGLRRPPRPRRSRRSSRRVEVSGPDGSDSSMLVEVAGLSVAFPGDDGAAVQVVSDVSFRIGRGEIVGLVGESGCGKSVTAMSLLGLVPAPGVASGSIVIDGQQIVGAAERRLTRLRGGHGGPGLPGSRERTRPGVHDR